MEQGRWSKEGQRLLLELLLELPLHYWAGERRSNLLELLNNLDQKIMVLDQAAKKAAEENKKARLLMTQPGVGPITSLAFVLAMGDVTRFPRGNQVASCLGLISLIRPRLPLGFQAAESSICHYYTIIHNYTISYQEIRWMSRAKCSREI